MLKNFDMRIHKVSTLFKSIENSVALNDESKPVREVLKANYGVSYREDVNEGGQANCRM